MQADSPYDQSRYQVRFEWGERGLARLAPSRVVVLVDVLHRGLDPVSAVRRDGRGAVDADTDVAAIARRAASDGALVLAGAIVNAAAVAGVIAGVQAEEGRTAISVIAAGDGADGDPRFTVEDLLGAGAVIDALTAVGIDHTSPEAAAACEAYRGLGRATRHLLTASGSGQRLLAAGRRDDVLAAGVPDATDVVPVLRDGAFVPHPG